MPRRPTICRVTLLACSMSFSAQVGGVAVPVRPDRFIAWRHPAGTGEPRAALAAALSQILASRPARRSYRQSDTAVPAVPDEHR